VDIPPIGGTGAQRALRTADLTSLGVGRGELAGPRWRAPFRGVHTPQVAGVSQAHQRVYDAVELLTPGGAVGGWAAAHLLGVRDLDGLGRDGTTLQPVLLLSPTRQHPAPRPGVRVFRSRLEARDVCTVEGIRVTSPLRTAFDLARAGSVEDGVVALDAVVRDLGLTKGALAEFVRQHPKYRGVPVAREVLRLVDPGARSPGESRLRFVWVVEAGLPPPQVNPYIVDERGEIVAMADLLDDATGLVAEYDGAHHRQLRAHTADNAREETLEGLGLVVVRATSIDVGPDRAALVRRLREGRVRADANEHGRWGWAPTGPRPHPQSLADW
jgi:hypothetical protein